MKKAVAFLTAITLLFSACKKKDNETVLNQWTVDGTSFKAKNVYQSVIGFGFTADDGTGGTEAHSLTFLFAQAPKAGTYQVTDFASGANEVSVICYNGGPANVYRSTASETRSVQVQMINGKARLYFNNGLTLQPLLPIGTNPVEVAGVIQEK